MLLPYRRANRDSSSSAKSSFVRISERHLGVLGANAVVCGRRQAQLARETADGSGERPSLAASSA